MQVVKIFTFFILFSAIVYSQKSIINTSHLDYLYQEVKKENETFGIIHIYSEAPDYKWVGDLDEGIACIDDASRAAIFYIQNFQNSSDTKDLNKIKNLINFIFYMQADNGFFYNFIWEDLSINKEFKTSVPEPNWWSWRAIWALSEGAVFFKSRDEIYFNKIKLYLAKSIDSTISWLNMNKDSVVYGGYILPGFLPFETASDQAAVIVKALSKYYPLFKDEKVKKTVEHLCMGIMQMQQGNPTTLPYYAYLSWQNTWHAWGNSQADALIEAGVVFNRQDFFESALKEIDYFYPFLMKEGFYSSLTFIKQDTISFISDKLKFAQIAYGIRPMVFASLNAYHHTGNIKYLNTAIDVASWFFGINPAKKFMYDVGTGRVYDGIIDYGKINKNSGAESTIEGLLTINRIESDSTARQRLVQLFKQLKKD